MTRLLIFLILIWITIFALSGLTSCKDTITDSSEIIFPDDSISYSKYIGPLFQQKCARSPCHISNSTDTDLNLEYPSYSALLNKPGLVIPRNANQSALAQHLDGRLSPMPPPNFPQLTQNQITGIKKWIDEGAKNN